MSLRTVYLSLCMVGIVLPGWQVIPWLVSHGLDLPLFVQELFINRISSFFANDVIVSATVLMVLVFSEGRSLRIHGLWAPIIGTLLIGVSCGLPLYLYLREGRKASAA